MYITVHFICILADASCEASEESENYRMKNSCPQWDSNPLPKLRARSLSLSLRLNTDPRLIVNSMWAYIKDTIQSKIKKHVPTRRTLAKHSHPWMNSDLRRLSNMKQRAYTQAKRSGATKDWRRYKSLKAELQRSPDGHI